MYDNETEQFVDLGDLCNNADWYIETEGGMFTPSLYIIPHDMNLENMGPDNTL